MNGAQPKITVIFTGLCIFSKTTTGRRVYFVNARKEITSKFDPSKKIKAHEIQLWDSATKKTDVLSGHVTMAGATENFDDSQLKLFGLKAAAGPNAALKSCVTSHPDTCGVVAAYMDIDTGNLRSAIPPNDIRGWQLVNQGGTAAPMCWQMPEAACLGLDVQTVTFSWASSSRVVDASNGSVDVVLSNLPPAVSNHEGIGCDGLPPYQRGSKILHFERFFELLDNPGGLWIPQNCPPPPVTRPLYFSAVNPRCPPVDCDC